MSVVIDKSNYFGLVLRHSIKNFSMQYKHACSESANLQDFIILAGVHSPNANSKRLFVKLLHSQC